MVFKSFLSKVKDIDILASLPDGIMLIDSIGKIEWMNKIVPAFLGIGKSEILKLNINDIFEGGLDLAKQAAISNKSVVGQAKSAEGIDLYIEITAKSMEDCFVVALREITQNYKTVANILMKNENSKRNSKDKNLFLVKMSNELKSPIHSIIGFSQAMLDGLGGEMNEKQEKYTKIINKNSNEILYLLDKIIELSKIESNLFEYEFQVFDVINTMQNILKSHEKLIKSKSLNLFFDSEEVVKRTIFSDENAFKIIFQNILEIIVNLTDIGSINIKVFHPESDFVLQQDIEVLDSISDKTYLMITISDTGAGISENDLDIIFEPYAQLDKINKKNILRSIALASVKNIIRNLKGTIWVESKPMQGTVYNLIIPIEKRETEL